MRRVTGAVGHNCVDSLKHRAYLNGMSDPNHHLDALGLLCPLPVLKARKRLQALPPGDELTLLADDPAAMVDVPHFCAEKPGMTLVDTAIDGDGSVQTYVIRKKTG